MKVNNMKCKESIIIDVKDVIRNTPIEKVARCYDFKKCEIDEIVSLKNKTDLTLNEFRWGEVRDILEIVNDKFKDMGIIVKELIEDIQMGYHRLSDEDISYDIEHKFEINDIYEAANPMRFNFDVIRDCGTNSITRVCVYFDDDNLTDTEMFEEFKEILEYLELV